MISLPHTDKHSSLYLSALAEQAERNRKAEAAAQRLFFQQIKKLWGEALLPSQRIFFDIENRTALVDGVTLRHKRVPDAIDGFPDHYVLLHVRQCPSCEVKLESLPLHSLGDLKHYIVLNTECGRCRAGANK